VPRDRLVEFYRKVRPWGAWGPVAEAAGAAPQEGLLKALGQWAAGTIMVLSATLSIGAFVLADAKAGLIYLAAAFVSAAYVWLSLRRL